MNQLPFPRRNLECLLLLTLHKDRPQSTGALMDAVACLCQQEDLPDALWRGLDGNRMRGKLDGLCGQGFAKRGPPQRDPAKGRDVPTWLVLADIPEQWRQDVLASRRTDTTPARSGDDDMTARVLDMCDVIESIAATLRRVYGGAE